MNLDLANLEEFSEFLISMSRTIGFKVSARGWAYLLEQERLINKDEFDKINNLINKCRKRGYLPINFTAEESARAFSGIEHPAENDVVDEFGSWLKATSDAADYYTPDWWDGEEYYIQMLVEKIDLVTLFSPVCKEFHIPIANSKGWSSMLQRAEYCRRFKEAENKGLKCVLLYCGDHDPDGLRISDFIRKNLSDLKNVKWSDGFDGYDPSDLIVDRFGLNYEFIQENDFTWIDNLITGGKISLASPSHKNFNMPYVQNYLKDIGERKCEANAIITLPEVSRKLVTDSIEKYVGLNARERFNEKRQLVRSELEEWIDESGTKVLMSQIFEKIKNR